MEEDSNKIETDPTTECRKNCGQLASDDTYGLCSNCYDEAVHDIPNANSDVDDLLAVDPEEIFEWEEIRLDEALSTLKVETGTTWSQSKKAYELMNAIKQRTSPQAENFKAAIDKDELMLKILTSQQLALAKMMEKVEANQSTESTKKKSRNKKKENKQPEKLSRGLDFSSFLEWEKTWNLYMISEKMEEMEDSQKTAKLLGFFSTELLNDLEKDFKICLTPKQKLEDVMQTVKDHLKSQRPMLMTRYRLFTRNQHPGESFTNWNQELMKIAEQAEIENLSKDELLTIIIATGMKGISSSVYKK